MWPGGGTIDNIDQFFEFSFVSARTDPNNESGEITDYKSKNLIKCGELDYIKQ